VADAPPSATWPGIWGHDRLFPRRPANDEVFLELTNPAAEAAEACGSLSEGAGALSVQTHRPNRSFPTLCRLIFHRGTVFGRAPNAAGPVGLKGIKKSWNAYIANVRADEKIPTLQFRVMCGTARS